MRMILLFSHTLTAEQEADARENLGVDRFLYLPTELQQRFSNVPADLDDLHAYALPLRQWLRDQAQPGEPVLLQGDYGLTYILLHDCLELQLVPVYACSERQVLEIPQADGTVLTQRVFRHRRFRRYSRQVL